MGEAVDIGHTPGGSGWVPSRSGGFQPLPGMYSRTTLAGTPATTQQSGTSPRTTEPAATTTFLPTAAPGSTIAPAPSHVPEPMDTVSLLGHCLPIGVPGSA